MFIETSAKTGYNVKQVSEFRGLVPNKELQVAGSSDWLDCVKLNYNLLIFVHINELDF